MTKHKTRTAEVTICIISERLLDRPRQLPNSSKLVKVPIGKREGAQVQSIWGNGRSRAQWEQNLTCFEVTFKSHQASYRSDAPLDIGPL